MIRKLTFIFVAMILLTVLFSPFGRDAQAKEELIKIVATTEPSTLDHSTFASSADTIVNRNWGEYLLNKATNGDITTGLVTSWKMTPDGKKMECTLRKGVKFHSGDLLTTKDVEFSLERGRAKCRSTKSIMKLIKQLEIIDDYHFVFHFKAPDVLFIPRQAGLPIVSRSYHERVGEKAFVKNPSGTGPYKVVNYEPGQYVEIERFEEYWGKKPPIKRARIYFVAEDTTRTAKLKAGEVDLIRSIPFTEVDWFEKSPDFKVAKLETLSPTTGITFGHKNPKMPWYDKRVRLAMAHALDCQSIIKSVLLGKVVHLPGLAPYEVGYDPGLKPYGYDPEKSKKLLAEAGYPNGFKMEMKYNYGGRVAMAPQIAEAIASYFEAVGIRTKLVAKEQAMMVKLRRTQLDPKAEFIAYHTTNLAGGVDPIHTLTGFYITSGARPIFSNPEVDRIVDQARSTINDEKRAELIKKALRIIHDEVGSIPILSNTCYYGMKKNIDFNPTQKINMDYLLVKDMAFK